MVRPAVAESENADLGSHLRREEWVFDKLEDFAGSRNTGCLRGETYSSPDCKHSLMQGCQRNQSFGTFEEDAQSSSANSSLAVPVISRTRVGGGNDPSLPTLA